MSDGAILIMLVLLCAIFFAVHGVRIHLSRIADFCERSEKRMKETRP